MSISSKKKMVKEDLSAMLERIRHENEALKHLIEALKSLPSTNEKTK